MEHGTVSNDSVRKLEGLTVELFETWNPLEVVLFVQDRISSNPYENLPFSDGNRVAKTSLAR